MSVRQGLLALLSRQPMYGAQLKSEFEEGTGGTWPINIGQIYTTLARLERDGLVEQTRGPDEEGRIAYRLTPTGSEEIDDWWLTPVHRDRTPRDELVIKVALAVTAPQVDVQRVIQAQRTATLNTLRDLTRQKTRPPTEGDTGTLAWELVLENLIFSAESEARWLDHIESRMARERQRTTDGRTPPTPHTPHTPATSMKDQP